MVRSQQINWQQRVTRKEPNMVPAGSFKEKHIAQVRSFNAETECNERELVAKGKEK
ncbi:hypothetical protein [Spongiimicrobium sp. 3-5]|uniref:hypothetical protein n=1 Tax=Spongiimicrobium sp. 3-5 TaxID=3332596 RepID=UPI003981841A